MSNEVLLNMALQQISPTGPHTAKALLRLVGHVKIKDHCIMCSHP